LLICRAIGFLIDRTVAIIIDAVTKVSQWLIAAATGISQIFVNGTVTVIIHTVADFFACHLNRVALVITHHTPTLTFRTHAGQSAGAHLLRGQHVFIDDSITIIVQTVALLFLTFSTLDADEFAILA